MARYTGPKWRVNRRENATVAGVSEKWKRRPTAPGQFAKPLKRPTEYATQFREKQKVKRTYGMMEKQFRRFYAIAQKAEGNTGTRFLQLLELRLDNVLFRLGFAHTRDQARQMVTHGHVLVNGKKHDIPSTILKAGDEIMIKPKVLTSPAFAQRVSELEAVKAPAWLEKYSTGGKVMSEPTRDMIDPTIKERLIIELYSK
jgi:small subunit ribosomal protein S4